MNEQKEKERDENGLVLSDWLENPHGVVIAIEKSRVRDCIKAGFKRVKAPNANASKTATTLAKKTDAPLLRETLMTLTKDVLIEYCFQSSLEHPQKATKKELVALLVAHADETDDSEE